MHIPDREYIPGTAEFAARMAKDHAQLMVEEIARKKALAAQEKVEALAEIERRRNGFKARVDSFGDDIETVFTHQAQQLHGMFAQAVDDFASAGADDMKTKLYSAIALRAQNYCRMTLSSMIRVRELGIRATITGKKRKIEDPAIMEGQNETMDTASATETGRIDPQLAAVENSNAENRQG